VGTTALDGSTAEITSGVSEGDTVVIDGVDKLQDGSKIISSKPGAGRSGGSAPPAEASVGSSS